MHAESGYWRPKPDGTIEVVIAQSNGLVEVQVLFFNLIWFCVTDTLFGFVLVSSGGARKIIKPGQKFKEDNAVSEHHHRSHIFPTIHALSTNRLKKN